MFKKFNRLRRDSEIKIVLQKGKGAYNPLFGLRFLVNDLSASRFAIVISNKVHKKSTKRNRLRRQIREIIRANLANFNQNYDLAIMVRPKTNILEQKYPEIEKNLLNLMKKSGITKV